MESRLARLEHLMMDKTLPHSDQQLLDQELDELLREMGFPTMGDREEPPECDCADCVASASSAGEAEVAADPDPNEWVDDREGCGNCAGCAYCMVLGDYEPDGEV